MDSKMAVLSTTNHLYNTSLYGSLTHKSLVALSLMHQQSCHSLEPLPCILPGPYATSAAIHDTRQSCPFGIPAAHLEALNLSVSNVEQMTAMSLLSQEWVVRESRRHACHAQWFRLFTLHLSVGQLAESESGQCTGQFWRGVGVLPGLSQQWHLQQPVSS